MTQDIIAQQDEHFQEQLNLHVLLQDVMYLHLKFCQQESPELLNAQQVIIALQDQVRQLYAQQELITQSKAKEYQQHVLLVQQVSLFQA